MNAIQEKAIRDALAALQAVRVDAHRPAELQRAIQLIEAALSWGAPREARQLEADDA